MLNWMRGKGVFLELLIDTQVLVWLVTADKRMSSIVLDALARHENSAYVSAVTACEYTELQRRGRLPVTQSIAEQQGMFAFELLDFPAGAWRIAAQLPNIHRDPIDRMLIAHAIHADLTLVSADAQMKQYPVKLLW